ncbi:MAG: hypothetical protein ACYTDX_09145, partial [Planctomycetota bacterium]
VTMDGGEPEFGRVYEKATIADPETRTFQVSIITRNRRSAGGLPADDPLMEFPRVDRVFYPVRFGPGGDRDAPFCVEANRALHKDADGSWFVWTATNLTRETSLDPTRPVLKLKKVSVVPGEAQMNLQGLYLMRVLDDPGSLDDSTAIPLDVPEGTKDGDEILFAPERWTLYPGQLAKVQLSADSHGSGLYVPMDAIQPYSQESGALFVESGGTAKRVPVRLGARVGDVVRVEPDEGAPEGLLTDGARVITDHVHFLQDGEPVQVVSVRKAKP